MKNRLNFTMVSVAKLLWKFDPEHPKRDHVYFYDTKRAGLCVRVMQSGVKTYCHYRKVDGRPERVRLGSIEQLTVDQAREAADRINGKIADGANPAEQLRKARGEQTLAEVFDRYIADYAKIHKRTWEDDQKQFERYAASVKGKRLSDIDRQDIQKLHTATGEKHGHYAANRLAALLCTVFNFARDIGFTGPNPAQGIKRFREESRERFIHPDEMGRFLAALDAHDDQQIADFFRVALFTGARRSNVQSMAWSDVNFGRRTWTIPADQSKNGKPMTIHLSEPAMEALQRRWQERHEDSAFVFATRSSTGHLTEPKGAWKIILERAKLTDLRIHDLRRTHGSWLASGGASLPMIGKALGHKSTASTAIYSRLTLDPIKSVIDAAAGAMVGAATPKKITNRKAAAHA